MTTYFRSWWHDEVEYPPLGYYEVGEDRWVTRLVDVHLDGRMDYADEEGSAGDGMLPEAAVPPLEDIQSNPEFHVEEITQAEFEEVAHRALTVGRWEDLATLRCWGSCCRGGVSA